MTPKGKPTVFFLCVCVSEYVQNISLLSKLFEMHSNNIISPNQGFYILTIIQKAVDFAYEPFLYKELNLWNCNFFLWFKNYVVACLS